MGWDSEDKLREYYLNCPPDRFFSHFRSDALNPISNIIRSAELINEMLSDEQLDKEGIKQLADITKRSAEYLKTLLDIGLERDEIQRKNNQNTSQENPDDGN